MTLIKLIIFSIVVSVFLSFGIYSFVEYVHDKEKEKYSNCTKTKMIVNTARGWRSIYDCKDKI